MKYHGRYNDVAYYIKKKGPMEFVPVVAGVSLTAGQTINEAVGIAVAAIKGGMPLEFVSTITWPASPSTSRSVKLDAPEKCECFCDLMFKTINRGGTVSIGPGDSGGVA